MEVFFCSLIVHFVDVQSRGDGTVKYVTLTVELDAVQIENPWLRFYVLLLAGPPRGYIHMRFPCHEE
jgi:hypothetical protein